MDKQWIVFDFTAAGLLIGISIHVIFTTDWLAAIFCIISGVLFFIGGISRLKRL